MECPRTEERRELSGTYTKGVLQLATDLPKDSFAVLPPTYGNKKLKAAAEAGLFAGNLHPVRTP
jgi:hypothetical protein